MSEFLRALHALNQPRAGRRWVYVPYDQLTDAVGPLAQQSARELGIVLLENPGKAGRRPYHKQKLALVLANGRHFALEQARRGVAVYFRSVEADGYVGALRAARKRLGPLTMMEAAERELRRELAPLRADGTLQVLPHAGWLTTHEDFTNACGAPPWRMDAFYRAVRKKYGWLLDAGKPVGGKWSLDSENRKAWHGEPAAPTPPRFTPDAITREVIALVERRYTRHPGAVNAALLPSTREDSEELWDWAKRACLPAFGPYEDAMSVESSGLFHTRISPLLNLQRLSARRVLDEALALPIPLQCKEGFLRQLAGWREYMRHAHRASRGFRKHPASPSAKTAGDGGYASWSGQPWNGQGGDLGALPDLLQSTEPLPPAYWGRTCGMRCLDTVVKDVWSEGYSHHITRLMVLANIAMLVGASPRELCDWFWVAYADAYDWVVEPNVLAMGSFATGPLLTTKPYVAGAAYIDRMSDYCRGCRFDPKRNCPITSMYWAFLARHRELLQNVARMDMPLRSLDRRAPAQRARDLRVLAWVQQTLREGGELRLEDLPEAVPP